MRDYTVARIWGIPIRLNVSLLVFAPFLVWLIGSGDQIPFYAGVIGDFTGATLDPSSLTVGAMPWVVGAIAAVGLFVSVTLHELGHSWMAMRYDIEIESITLWIFGGIASMSRIPREWERELWIALAGPAVSLALAVGFNLGARLTPSSLPLVIFVLGWLAIINVTLTAFNMLPAFPMDGGRVLRALLSRSRPYAEATRIAARVGVGFALFFGFVGILNFNIILILIAWFIYGAATTESRVTQLDDMLEGLTVADVMAKHGERVSVDVTLDELADRVMIDHRTVYPVEDAEGNVVGIVDLERLGKLSRETLDATTIEDVYDDEPLRLDEEGDAFDALVALGQARANASLVERDGAVVGVVSQADFGRLFDLKKNLRFAQ